MVMFTGCSTVLPDRWMGIISMLTRTARNGSAAAMVMLVFLDGPERACAGMPMVLLSDLTRMRFQTISFFMLVLLGSSWLVQRIWNALQRDFPGIPRLDFMRALGLVIIWGFLFVLVLTMISGARELMTPGAGRSRGSPTPWPKALRITTEPGRTRRSRSPRGRQNQATTMHPAGRRSIACGSLSGSTRSTHDSRFPVSTTEPEIPEKAWRTADPSGLHFVYRSGLKADEGALPLAYEPGLFGPDRWSLLTDGTLEETADQHHQDNGGEVWGASQRSVNVREALGGWTMKWLRWILAPIVALVLLVCMGLAFPIDLLIAVTLGWAFYLYRVVPQVHINGNGVATAIICLLGFVLGLHSFLKWFVRSSRKALPDVGPPPWRARWTAALVGITLLMFVAGMAAAGFVHQVGWLITSSNPGWKGGWGPGRPPAGPVGEQPETDSSRPAPPPGQGRAARSRLHRGPER